MQMKSVSTKSLFAMQRCMEAASEVALRYTLTDCLMKPRGGINASTLQL